QTFEFQQLRRERSIAKTVGFRFTPRAFNLRLRVSFRLRNRFGYFRLRHSQLITSAFRLGDRLGLLRDGLLDRLRESRLADETKLLDSNSYSRYLLLHASP